MLPNARDLQIRRLEVVCEGRATLVLAALLLHKSRTGAFPDSLDSLRLKPEGLPLDPFAEGPFGYIRKGPGCLIYSYGPDGNDDKGVRNVAGAGHWPEPADGDLVYVLGLEPVPSASDSACPVALKPEPAEEGSSRWLWYLGLLALAAILVGVSVAVRARLKRSSCAP